MFINTLERGVMCHRAVGEREPPGVGDALDGPITLHYLGGEKEILDLFFGKSGLIRGPDNTPSAPDRQLRIFAIAIGLEFPRVRFSVA